MKSKLRMAFYAVIAGLFIIGALSGEVLADGTEELGPPKPEDITIASGTGIVAAGTGLLSQPGTISMNVPTNAVVKQVLLYWEGIEPLGAVTGDDTAIVQGNGVTGVLIGGPTGDDFPRFAYRADITNLALVAQGPNILTVEGLDFGNANNGAGILVIIDDGLTAAEISIRDGEDYAFDVAANADPLKTTVPQTFTFPASANDRTGTLAMFFASVSGTASGGGFRPSAIEITIGGTTTVLDNLLDSNDGQEWDTLTVDVNIPAGATSMTVQALSVDNDPPDTGPEGQVEGFRASFSWVTAGLSVPPPPACGDGIVGNTPGETCDPPGSNAGQPNECTDNCTFCGDGNQDPGEGCDDGNNVDGDGCSAQCQSENCDVLVDKIINCGTGDVDKQLVSANDDGTNGCTADNTDSIIVSYEVQNTGSVPLVNCTLSDSNKKISLDIAVTSITPGQAIMVDPTEAPLTCSDELDDAEPDTLTIVCDCAEPGGPLGSVSAFDRADIECLPICGDGTIDPNETCDPPGTPAGGNGNDCRDNCTVCGDGMVNDGEECDDGNGIDTDNCRNNCTVPTCGDGTIDPNETCDPPGTPAGGNGNDCRDNCTVCGDGMVNDGEACDDGNGIDTDSCRNNCTVPTCGDGTIDPNETCDPPGTPAGGNGNDCRDNCTVCGDGMVNDGEECDDGNGIDTDDCRNNCTVPTCGDGTIDPNETCDPPGTPAGGNGNDCRDNCTVCGDGMVNDGEACDDGNGIDTDSCRNNCTVPTCGDGTIDPNETCDPPGTPAGGNGNDCRDNCTVCGDGMVNDGEECDDGDGDNNDECRNNCTVPKCGDGILDPGEECDDGNNIDGDGCSATCTIEGGGEGCTPGYWKQCQHFGSWTAPLTPDTLFSVMFGSNVFGNMTLLEVLSQGGGGINALGRHAVAALLNAASPDVSYDRNTMQVKMMFNNALANGNIEEVKDMLAGFNEQGCPVGRNPGRDCDDKNNKNNKDKDK